MSLFEQMKRLFAKPKPGLPVGVGVFLLDVGKSYRKISVPVGVARLGLIILN